MSGTPNSIWVLGIGILIASFLTVNWLTKPITPTESGPPSPETPLAVFESFTVSDDATLSAAASSARLNLSRELRGVTDEVSRINADRVKIRGWSADPARGVPITIIVFADGKWVLETQTKGPRPDVANALKLSEAAALNVAFEGVLSCRPGQPLFVVAVTQSNSYVSLGPQKCP